MDNIKFENSEFEQIKHKFNVLVREGKEFGDNLVKEKSGKKKTISDALSTPYEYNSDDGRAISQIKETISADSMKSFVQQIFKHYDVNPSIEDYNKRIVDTYVNENLDIIKYLKKEFRIINEDDKFRDEIIELVGRIRAKDEVHQNDRQIYITGIRGAGKTSYINYFISKYEKELNNNKIISIRINVLRIKPYDSLIDAIKFKICRILFTYYCTLCQENHERLENRNIKDILNQYLLDIINDDANDFCENDIKICSDSFKYYISKEPKKIPEEYKELCKLLLIRIMKDYNFIIFLDNFDQITPNDKDIYIRRMDDLTNLNISDFFNHYVYVIAIRYSTYNTINPHAGTDKKCHIIGTPTTFDMLDKRIKYFSTISNSQQSQKKINCFKNLIILIGNNFMPKTNNTTETINFQQACNFFDDLFYGNKRLIIKMIDRFINIIPQSDFELLCEMDCDYNYDNLFDQLISQTYYKFFESLLINVDTGYCHCFFEYKKDTIHDKYEFSSINSTAHFDKNFLPHIYRFPAISNVKDVQFIPFLKIRILQLLNNYPLLNDDNLSQNIIAKKLHEIFDYRTDVIHLACEELRWDQSIIIIEKEPEDDDSYKNELKSKPLDITPRGKKLLEILPSNINLLAISMEHIFFPKSFIKTGVPFGNYNDKDISKFIIRNKFFSLPKIIGLLSAVEKHEKNILLRTNKRNQEHFSDSDFTITEKLKEISNKSIERIYFSYFDNKNDEASQFIIRRNHLKEQLGIK
jgi:hypothetical protein